jgi:hypothetical protein
LVDRLAKEAWQESLPSTPFSATPQDYNQLYLKLTATQRQLIKAREALQKRDDTLVGMQVRLLSILNLQPRFRSKYNKNRS